MTRINSKFITPDAFAMRKVCVDLCSCSYMYSGP